MILETNSPPGPVWVVNSGRVVCFLCSLGIDALRFVARHRVPLTGLLGIF
jgi:purine-cytosine permease-like protein